MDKCNFKTPPVSTVITLDHAAERFWVVLHAGVRRLKHLVEGVSEEVSAVIVILKDVVRLSPFPS